MSSHSGTGLGAARVGRLPTPHDHQLSTQPSSEPDSRLPAKAYPFPTSPFPTRPFPVLSYAMEPASSLPSPSRHLARDRRLTGTFLSLRCRLARACDTLRHDLPCRPTGAFPARDARVMGAAQGQKAPKPRLHCELRKRIPLSRRGSGLCPLAAPPPISTTIAARLPDRACGQPLSFRTRHGMTGTMRRGRMR